ncbi:gamma-glutamyltransferase family protein [Ancylobacter mangrovi]|uniref:gamma-glutamyltransferase family protein n=1 Tax=Ancylobacter mangrovi TaxID=2972472 RepID=UPI0021625B69|nr:gamma-glutamyltransferase family protein [Ancylobacter mangrovi]MCS0502012.1 gamma-glutamyltransferase family protein [Ancylobacter mangrovi]
MRDFHRPGRSEVMATSAMAATSMPAASLVAIETLKAGGNAADAAVAAAAVLAVIEPQSTGIGGDCFCLYAPAGGEVVALNGAGRAPGAATIDYFEAHGIDRLDEESAHAVTVPGAVSAWEKLLETHGTMGFDEVLAPAIRMAEDGSPVHARVASDWTEMAEKLARNGAHALLPGGIAPATGDVVRNPALAASLRAIAKGGAAAFYEGAIADDMVATLRARGGLHTPEDFHDGRYAAAFVAPISLAWNGYRAWECPPPGVGLTALTMLGILERRGVAEGGPLDPLRLHRVAEAAKLAFRDRDALIGDDPAQPVPVAELTSDAHLDALAAMMDDASVLPSPPFEAELPLHRDTAYLAVTDRDGNWCSFINSLFDDFGGGLYAERSGVVFHNRGAGFRVERGHPNCIGPRKRPMHTIIPGLLTEGGVPMMAFGVTGGHFQPTGQSLLLGNVFDYGLDLQAALDLPRVFAHEGLLKLERGIPDEVARALAAKGHRLSYPARPHGGGQAIRLDRARGVLIGASDPRRDGAAIGY